MKQNIQELIKTRDTNDYRSFLTPITKLKKDNIRLRKLKYNAVQEK